MLFSGRFDRPHIGHIVTILRLGMRYKKILVIVLNYPEQEYSPRYRAQILDNVLQMAQGSYEVTINDEHFAEITSEEISAHGWEFDVYGSGNQGCLKNMENLGYQIEYVDRAYDYDATDDRLIKRIKGVLNG